MSIFPGTTLKDFVHYKKLSLQENEFDTSILHMSVNDVLKLDSNIDKRYHKHCKPLQKFRSKTIHYFRSDTY